MLDDDTFLTETVSSPWTLSKQTEQSHSTGMGGTLCPSNSAGEELNFSDMFETESSFDHRRSRSVLSLDGIPEHQPMNTASLERNGSAFYEHQSARIEEEESNGDKNVEKLGPADFEILAVIGQGAFGKVFQVKKKDTGQIYAMKVMKKSHILEKDHTQYVWSERDCLTSIQHPYIVPLYYSFQTNHKLYMILEFLTGGHLFFQLYQQGCFSEQQTRLYAAELVSAVSFLHQNGIVHRDLKPENVLLDSEGHIKITDFGLSKGNMVPNDDSRADSFVGTIQYMAPEILQGKPYTAAVDWWSVGVLIYEMIHGEPPFDYPNRKKEINEKDRKKLMNRIISAQLHKSRFISQQAWSLIQGLLSKNVSERQKTGNTVRTHPFFKKISWEEIEGKRMISTFKPESKSNPNNVEKKFRNMPAIDSPGTTPDHPNLVNAFQGYSYTTPGCLANNKKDKTDAF
eukprot:g7880.t1